jgi:hypothetical protein
MILKEQLPPSHWLLSLALTSLLLILATALAGCGLLPVSKSEASKQTQIRETQIDINVRQTLLVQQQNEQHNQQTIQAQQSTMTAQVAALNPGGSQATSPAPQSTPAVPNPEPPSPAPQATQPVILPSPPVPPTPVSLSPDELAKRMQTANILLYEDMTTRLDTIRYVKPVLDKMGLKYKDDGAAGGWLRDDVAKGPGDGKPWDLVIIAAEDKKAASGEFFSYVTTTLDKGSSAIMETWFLDSSYSGLAMGMMDRCGLIYDGDWVKIAPGRTVLFALDPSNPILNEPNSGMSFSKSTAYWWDPNGKLAYDVGDLVRLKPGSSSKLLLGTTAEAKDSHGTLTECLDGRLILQTFSDHQFSLDNMSLLWQNYIYNALKARFEAFP